MAPETFLAPSDADKELTERALDIWACGVTLFYMLSKRFPFEAKNLPDLKQETLHGEADLQVL